jgi:hypothetical protein
VAATRTRSRAPRSYASSDLSLPRPIASFVIAPKDRPDAIVRCPPPSIRLLSIFAMRRLSAQTWVFERAFG